MNIDDTNPSQASVRIREIAFNCLGQNSDDGFSCILTDDDQKIFTDYVSDDFAIEDDKISFGSAEAITQLSAEHFLYDKKVESEIDYISLALELADKEGRGDHTAAGRYLALVSKKNNIFQCAAAAVSIKKHRTFDILAVIQAALPHINEISIPGLIAMCDAQHEHTRNDLMGGYFFSKLAEIKKGDHAFFRELLSAVHDDLRESTSSLYTRSLFDLINASGDEAFLQAHKDTNSDNPVLVANALWFLGQIAFQKKISPDQLNDIVPILRTKAFDPDDEMQRAAINAVVHGGLSHPVLSDFLDELLQVENQTALGTLAVTIFQNSDVANKHPNHDQWVAMLSKLSPALEGAISSMDSILSSLFKEGHHDQVISCLEEWFIAHGAEVSRRKEIIEPFKTTIYKIIENEPIRSRLLTEWVVSDERPLIRAYDALLGELHLQKITNLSYCPNVISGFDTETLILLLRRTIGIVMHDDQIVPLVFSLLDVKKAPEGTFELVEEALSNDIGIDFPNMTQERLQKFKKSMKNKKLKQMCDRVNASIEAYFDALNALPRIKELMPDQSLALRISRQQAKVMRKHQKEAEKDSVFVSLCSRVLLKAGRASFSFYSGKYMPPTQMQSFEYSVTLPRRHNLDTVGYEMQRLHYRHATKGSK